MIDLSIIVLFCDKDFNFLNSKLQELKQKIKLNYEVLLLDNRENNKEVLTFNDNNVKIFSYNKNYYNYSRHTLVKEASGKYIWFIDVDDNIFEIGEEFKKFINQNEEEYYFNFITDETREAGIAALKYIPIWCRWIRADLAKERLNKLSLVPICFFDDDIICAQLDDLKAKEEIDFTIYKYNIKNSTFAKSDRLFSSEELKKFFNIEAIESELILTNKLYLIDEIITPGIKRIIRRLKSKEELLDYIIYFKSLNITENTKQKFLKEIVLVLLENDIRVDKIVAGYDKTVRS